MTDASQASPSPLPPKRPSDTKILGINMLAFVGYSLACISLGSNGFILAFIVAGVHGIICIILAIVQNRWIWALVAGLIMLIGFGTCLGALLGG